MPTRDELSGIAALDRANPTIDTAYFPNTLSSLFWSSSPAADGGSYAWSVYFFFAGYVSAHHKGSNYQVRLVRIGQ
jgi:hypothetical protein